MSAVWAAGLTGAPRGIDSEYKGWRPRILMQQAPGSSQTFRMRDGFIWRSSVLTPTGSSVLQYHVLFNVLNDVRSSCSRTSTCRSEARGDLTVSTLHRSSAELSSRGPQSKPVSTQVLCLSVILEYFHFLLLYTSITTRRRMLHWQL